MIELQTVKQVSQELNLSIYNIRYYCNLGLVPNLQRDSHGARLFDDEAINWLKAIQFFRNCGLSLKEIKHYFHLCLSPDNTLDERYRIINNLKKQTEQELQAIQVRNQVLANRLNHLQEIRHGKVRDDSNPLSWHVDKFCRDNSK